MSKWAAIDDHGKMHGYIWSGGHERRTQVTQAVGSIREGTFELACYLFERGSQRDWAKVKKTVDRMGAMLQGGLIYACRTKPRNNFILGNSTWHKRLRFIVREIPLPSAKLEHLPTRAAPDEPHIRDRWPRRIRDPAAETADHARIAG